MLRPLLRETSRRLGLALCLLLAAAAGLRADPEPPVQPSAPAGPALRGPAPSAERAAPGSTRWDLGPLSVEHTYTYDEDVGRQERLVVRRAGRTLLDRRAWSIAPGVSAGAPEDALRDLTGDGRPELLVTEWSGGAHCCYTLHAYELQPTFRPLFSADLGHGGASLRDVDGDGAAEVVAPDWTYAYWRTCFASSPAPEVIYAWRDGALRPALDLMRRPAPPALSERVAAVRAATTWQDGRPPVELWATVLDLLYTGHPTLAWGFLEAAWAGPRAEREAFRRDLLARLRESPVGAALLGR